MTREEQKELQKKVRRLIMQTRSHITNPVLLTQINNMLMPDGELDRLEHESSVMRQRLDGITQITLVKQDEFFVENVEGFIDILAGELGNSHPV